MAQVYEVKHMAKRGGWRVYEVFTGDVSRKPSREIIFWAIDQGSAHAVAAALATYWADQFTDRWMPPTGDVYPVQISELDRERFRRELDLRRQQEPEALPTRGLLTLLPGGAA